MLKNLRIVPRIPDKISLSGKLGREISNVIGKHKAFFDEFDKIIVYYDNGQIELGAILNTVFSIHFSNVEFRKAEPQKYRLLQAADFICSMKLLKIKKNENCGVDRNELRPYTNVRK